MRDGDIIALIYAHATDDKDLWNLIIKRIWWYELKKGNNVLAQDILDADNGIRHTSPSVNINVCELSSDTNLPNNVKYGHIITKELFGDKK